MKYFTYKISNEIRKELSSASSSHTMENQLKGTTLAFKTLELKVQRKLVKSLNS